MTSSAPPVATLRSLRTNGEKEEVEVEIDGDGDEEPDALLLLEEGAGGGGGISAAAAALLAAESSGGFPRSESTSRTWTASPSPSESAIVFLFFLSFGSELFLRSSFSLLLSSFSSFFFATMASPTALSAGAVQHAARVSRLYRHALKNIQSWAVDRELFWEEVKRKRMNSSSRCRRPSPFRLTIRFFSLSLFQLTPLFSLP